MARMEFATVVKAPLAKVWSFYDDPGKGIAALSPRWAQVRMARADMPMREGSIVAVSAKGPFSGRVGMVVKLVEHRPPHGVVFGEEARFVDEQLEGPFSNWRHEHEFEAVDEKHTRVVDRIQYRLKWGIAGWAADSILIRWVIRRMFRYRHQMTKILMEGDEPRP